MLEALAGLFCRHQWIRERRENGRLGLRCMRCMQRKEYNLLKLIEWQIDYEPICPAYPSQFPPPLPWTLEAERNRKEAERSRKEKPRPKKAA